MINLDAGSTNSTSFGGGLRHTFRSSSRVFRSILSHQVIQARCCDLPPSFTKLLEEGGGNDGVQNDHKRDAEAFVSASGICDPCLPDMLFRIGEIFSWGLQPAEGPGGSRSRRAFSILARDGNATFCPVARASDKGLSAGALQAR